MLSLLIGFGIGFALGGRDPEPQDVAADLRADLVAAAGSLEVAEIEYQESVSEGEVTRRAEYEGALGAIDSSRSTYREVEPAIAALVSDRADEISALYDQCASAMRERADATEVTGCLTELRELLKGETQ